MTTTAFPLLKSTPPAECGPREAAAILGCSRTHLRNIIEYYDLDEIIQWRWTGHRGERGKRLFNVASLHRYRDSLVKRD